MSSGAGPPRPSPSLSSVGGDQSGGGGKNLFLRSLARLDGGGGGGSGGATGVTCPAGVSSPLPSQLYSFSDLDGGAGADATLGKGACCAHTRCLPACCLRGTVAWAGEVRCHTLWRVVADGIDAMLAALTRNSAAFSHVRCML
jgi:hypothetical protein